MCRVFDDSDKQSKPNSILKTLSTIKSTIDKERDIYVKLVNESLDLLRQITPNLSMQSFSNEMFYYVLEIFNLLIQTNVLDHLSDHKSSDEKYSDFSNLMIHFLNIINFDDQKQKSTPFPFFKIQIIFFIRSKEEKRQVFCKNPFFLIIIQRQFFLT